MPATVTIAPARAHSMTGASVGRSKARRRWCRRRRIARPIARPARQTAMAGAAGMRPSSHAKWETIAMTLSFVHVHVHSDYSALRGVASWPMLCRCARQKRCYAIALTGTDGLGGASRCVGEAREQSLRTILGAEVVAAAHRARLW